MGADEVLPPPAERTQPSGKVMPSSTPRKLLTQESTMNREVFNHLTAVLV